ncbi:FAD-dependent oxidoreductase [Pseudonocardia endophytica]|uniref:Cholesterol oxidase n=1 Tax=Pseudonocardia endophytica TaxID=401976 RepID=A0A4R1HPB8_PSEEN|nr:FAD-dependent oxidoreductase [Pseudonocardia endophytica]TCK21579.1 cholesterol oxidase [Pseudonocardia endophytica]
MTTSPTGDEHVDVVVIGSGFGGAVTAYRLAEAGREVVVLERGKAYPPGSFPRSPREMSTAFWNPDDGNYGMFDVWSFDGLESIVSSGLGGGSLIYANVMLRKSEKSFVREDPLPDGGYESWPVTRADLDPHYDAVEAMLGVTRYPYARTPKTRAMREAATGLGRPWTRAPLAVSFAPRRGTVPEPGLILDDAEYPNLHGRPRRTCDLGGSCDIGCNEGAKNSLDHTYLSAAKHHGADLRTLCEVTGIAAVGERYEVRYRRHRPDDPQAPPDEHRVVANRVVLGAGAYGTTYLLLRSKDGLPWLSPALGSRFSGNGDLLAFLMPGTTERIFDASSGPVITSVMEGRGRHGRDFVVEDGGFPAFVNWMIEALGPAQTARTARFAGNWLVRRFTRHEDPRISDELADLVGGGSVSAGSLPLLGMGRDVPDGVMRLDGNRLAVDWTTETSTPYFDGVLDGMGDIARELGTELRENPLSHLRRVVSVHPLGGAPMGHHRTTGVCDDHGQVFGHPHLYVADGAAMPGPVGTNPSLTIAAFADRVADGILSDLPPQVSTPPGRPVHGSTPPTGLSFTEEMRGHVTLETDEGTREIDVAVHLTITVEDVLTFVSEPGHRATVEGWVGSRTLGWSRTIGEGSSFNLFVPGADASSRRMLYRLLFTDNDQNHRTLVGHKEIRDDPGPDTWRDTTTLFTRLLDGTFPDALPVEDGDAGEPLVGEGVLRITWADLMVQLTTFRTTGPGGFEALFRFGRFFFGQLWDVYGFGAPEADPPGGANPPTD